MTTRQRSVFGDALHRGFDRTFMFDAALEDRVRGSTLDEVRQAMSDRLDLSKMTIVKAGDFANNKPIIG